MVHPFPTSPFYDFCTCSTHFLLVWRCLAPAHEAGNYTCMRRKPKGGRERQRGREGEGGREGVSERKEGERKGESEVGRGRERGREGWKEGESEEGRERHLVE